MTSRPSTLSHHPPRSAFWRLLITEGKLACREPGVMVWGVGLPLVLLVIFGFIPAFNEPDPNLGGLTVLTIYVPVLVAFTLAALALVGVPTPLASYREQGVLRRLSTTPVPRWWVLAAQLIVNLGLGTIALVLIFAVGMGAFGVEGPKQIPGFVLSVVLTAGALFAMGLWVAAIARSARTAGAIGSALFFPLMFFAGLWFPREVMPDVLRTISDYTPLGAGVQALQTAMQGNFPPARTLLVLAAYAVVFGVAAVRFFKWE